MPLFRIQISLLFFAMFLLGCNLPKPQDRNFSDNEGASFVIDSFQGKAGPETLHANFSVPTSRVFNYTVCLKSHVKNQTLAGQLFRIRELGLDMTTDNQGCAHWSETVEYDYLAQSAYLEQSRTLLGIGSQRGSQKIHFAINPWSHGEDLTKAIDLRKEKLNSSFLVSDKSKIEKLSRSGNQERRLWIDNARLLPQRDQLIEGGKVSIKYEFHAQPQILLTKLQGDRFYFDLAKGRFRAQMKLIHAKKENQKEVRQVLPGSEKNISVINMENRNLTFNQEIQIAPPKTGHLYLAIVIDPIDGPLGLKSFEGVFYLGDFRALTNSAFLKNLEVASENESFQIQDFMDGKQKTSTIETFTPGEGSRSQNLPKVFGAEVNFTDLSFNRIIDLDKNLGQREIKYTVRTCANNNVTQTPLRGVDFKIKTQDRSGTELFHGKVASTDDGACLTWVDTLVYKAMDCQHFVKVDAYIENADLGVNVMRTYYVNPWGEPGFAIDSLNIQNEMELLSKRCEQNKFPRAIMIRELSFTANSFDVVMDPQLHLRSRRNFQLNVLGHFANYSSLAGQSPSSTTPLREGDYLLRLVLVSNINYPGGGKYIASASVPVSMNNSVMRTANMNIDFDDIFAIANSSTLYSQLLPLKNNMIHVKANGEQVLRAPESEAIDQSIGDISPIFVSTFLPPFVGTKTIEPVQLDRSEVKEFWEQNLGKIDSVNLLKIIENGKLERHQIYQDILRDPLANYSLSRGLLAVPDSPPKIENKILNELIRSFNPNLRNKRFGLTSKSDTSQISWTLDFWKRNKEWLYRNIDHPQLRSSLCNFWMRDYINEALDPNGPEETRAASLSMACELKRDAAESFFVVRPFYLVLDSDSKFLSTQSTDYRVGRNFTMSRALNHTSTFGGSLGIRVDMPAPLADRMPGIIAKSLKLFSGGVQMSWSNQDTESKSNSVTISRDFRLAVDQTVHEVTLKKYRHCKMIHLDSRLFRPREGLFGYFQNLLNVGTYKNFLNEQMPLADLEKILNKGIAICSQEVETKPKTYNLQTHILQPGSESSHTRDAYRSSNRLPFFAVIRSPMEKDRMVKTLFANNQTPSSATDPTETSIDKLMDDFQSAFTTQDSAPGILLAPSH